MPMPFSYKIAPSASLQWKKATFTAVIWRFELMYLDNILVSTYSATDHIHDS